MGAGSSKSSSQPQVGIQRDGDETTLFTQMPVRFDPALVEHLANVPSDPNAPAAPPSAGRQSHIDEHVRQRLRAEFERLQREEADVKRQIAEALERENLDRERKGSGSDAEADAPLNSSATLIGDLEEIKRKVEKHRERRDPSSWPEVAKARQGVVECLVEKKGRPLDCWKEAAEFKKAVDEVERNFVASLR